MQGWIDIVEFASKYGVSASTLRRRIRSNTISYKLERGKYLLEDSPTALSGAPLFSRANSPARQTMRVVSAPSGAALTNQVGDFVQGSDSQSTQLRQELDSVVTENRKLRAEIAELETLVKALEAELTSGEA